MTCIKGTIVREVSCTSCGARLGQLHRDRVVAIPTGVYYLEEADNFYDATQHGKGLSFYRQWLPYKHLFPKSHTAIVVRDMTLFSARNLKRCESPRGFNHAVNSWDLSDWFLAVIGEIGEAANIAKKLNRVRDGIKGNKEDEATLRNKLRKELGDAFNYLDLLATANGFNIFDAGQEVFEAKSKEIGYEE